MIEYLSNPVFWVGLGQIIVVNILLSGDNAVVIAPRRALAARRISRSRPSSGDRSPRSSCA